MNHYILSFSTKKNKISLGFLVNVLFFFIFNFKNGLSFEVNQVAEGLYVHFGEQNDSNEKNKGDIANIGFIVGSKSIAVIDTGGTPEIGTRLLKKIKETSSLPISHIIITHSHPDHFFGTEAFINNKVKIIGHENLKEH